MSRLSEKIARTKSLISIKTYKRPLIYIILLMVFINIMILTVAAGIALLIDDEFSNFIDAFANGSLKWMLAPNAILTIDNPDMLVLAVVVLMTGLVLFSGTIIALTTNAIKDYIQKKKSGAGKIHLDKHIVILNWNNKVPELVADLLYVDDMDVTVMILADIEKEYAEKQIVNAIKKTKNNDSIIKINVLVKNGDPLLRSDLLDISIEKAAAILIMNPDLHQTVYKQMSKSDLSVIKVILNLGPLNFIYQPPIVVEIKHIESKEKIETLSKVVTTLHEHAIMPICFDKRLGQIIAQTLIENQIEDVYLALFSFQGSEVYTLENESFEECLESYSHAIPLSALEDQLFVLSLSEKTKTNRSSHFFETKKLKTKPFKNALDMEIYILGTNNKLKFIMESLSAYEHIHQSKFKATWIDEDNIDTLIETVNASNQPTSILLLSDETQVEDALDANVIDNLIYLEGHLTNEHVRIIVELLNPKNDPIVKDFNIKNTIISNKIISLLLSKLALYKNTAPFYEDLLTIESDSKGVDKMAISIVDASACFNESFPLSFESKKQIINSVYHAYHKKYMIIGWIKEGQLTIFENDLHSQEILMLHATDQLVLIRI